MEAYSIDEAGGKFRKVDLLRPSLRPTTWNEPCRPLKPAGQTIRMLPEASR